ANLHDAAGTGRAIGGHHRVIFNRHRQDEAVVVIGMFTDDVDAARRGHDPARRAAIVFLKGSSDVAGEFWERHGRAKLKWRIVEGGWKNACGPCRPLPSSTFHPLFCLSWHRTASARRTPAERGPRRD